MDVVMQLVQTLGFPVAACIGVGIVFYKLLVRVMDENAEREEKYQTMLTEYGAKMSEISRALVDIKNDVSDIHHKLDEESCNHTSP